MTTILTYFILSLLIIIFIVAAVSFTLLSRQNKIFKVKHGYGSRTKYILSGYMFILLCGLVLFYLAPTTQPALQELSNEALAKEISRNDMLNQGLFNARNQEDLDELEGIYINGEWTFTYSEDPLYLSSNIDNYGLRKILLDRKDIDDGLVEVILYTTKTIINKIDVTHHILPPTITLSGKVLQVIQPERNEINVVKFSKELTITQFTGEKMFEDHPRTRGDKVLYIRIPKSLEITNDSEVIILPVRGK